MAKRFLPRYMEKPRCRSGRSLQIFEGSRLVPHKWSTQDGPGSDSRTATAVAELEGVRHSEVLLVLLPGCYATRFLTEGLPLLLFWLIAAETLAAACSNRFKAKASCNSFLQTYVQRSCSAESPGGGADWPFLAFNSACAFTTVRRA